MPDATRAKTMKQRTLEETSEIEKRQQQLIDAAAKGETLFNETLFNETWEKMFPKSESPSPANPEPPAQ
ncbi:hypothetical protein [Nevskia soli]|jgi:hypothetical protein|uniref:hypothetical protein n=1 Tax=Nevskia soli TaxID=418856 RepID=UPI0015D71891|nr:hypothetical protein [Nevskia soli]